MTDWLTDNNTDCSRRLFSTNAWIALCSIMISLCFVQNGSDKSQLKWHYINVELNLQLLYESRVYFLIFLSDSFGSVSRLLFRQDLCQMFFRWPMTALRPLWPLHSGWKSTTTVSKLGVRQMCATRLVTKTFCCSILTRVSQHIVASVNLWVFSLSKVPCQGITIVTLAPQSSDPSTLE